MKKLVLCLALLCAGPALAASPDNGEKRKGSDKICKSIKETGSRLASTRVCMTRDAWAEQRRQHRTELEGAQTRRLEGRSN